MQEKAPFWNLLREVWATVLDGRSNFVEKAVPPGQPNRYMQIMKMESVDVRDPVNREGVRKSIADLIEQYRAR